MKPLLLTALVLACGSSVLADALEVRKDASGAFLAVPLEYQGSFLWEGAEAPDRVRLLVRRASLGQNNTLMLEGKSFYGPDCSVAFRGVLNRLSGELSMTESLLDCEGGVVNGAYRGNSTSTLERLNAIWRGTDGVFGQLALRAVTRSYIRVLLR